MIDSATPVFAIVGHPNKGKSSIVSTLAQDSSVAVSAISGTTTINRRFPMQVDGAVLYELVDTPGFQRSRAALEWMQNHASSASEHRKTVEQFVEIHAGDERFAAECELLRPVLAGAGILYVIDGSTPYGHEYDSEMEILRWTGQPRMALINQIGSSEFFDNWRQPLSQYFSIVRNFDAQQASFERQLQLLTGFSELSEIWHSPLQTAASILRRHRQHQIMESATLIGDLLIETTSRSETAPISDPQNVQAIDNATQKYRSALSAMESACRIEVEALFQHNKLERGETPMDIENFDLFSEQTWSAFGLTRDQLVTAGIVGGAAGGGLLDIGSGGLTLFLGSGVGAVLGGAGAWFGSREMVKAKVMGLPMGGHQIIIGPVENPNFPWVLLGRAITHLQHVCKRTHSRRDALNIDHSPAGYLPEPIETEDAMNSHPTEDKFPDSLAADDRKSLQTVFSQLLKRKRLNTKQRETLTRIICRQIADWDKSLET